MKKHLIIIYVILCTIYSNANAQTATIDSINWQLRGLFGNLSKPINPKLFNWDMAFHTVDSSLFIENNTVDTITSSQWLIMYDEMRNSAYDTTVWLDQEDLYDQTNAYGPDTVNMMAMYFDYYRFKPNALNTNIYFNFDTVNNILTDKPGRPGFPYDDFTVFAAAPNRNIANINTVTYRVGSDFILSDNFNALDATSAGNNRFMHVNFYDGSGWHTINLGTDDYITITYPGPGTYPVETIVGEALGGNIDARSISYMKVSGFPFGPLDFPDEIINVHQMEIGIYEPCDSGMAPQLAKTIIYLEGYDIMDMALTRGMSRNLNQIYDEQIRTTGLADLRNFGYRILVVNWHNSRQNIHNNADNLVELLEDLKCGDHIGDTNPDEQFVIIGESMGGLIGNLALLKMEDEDYVGNGCYPQKKHNTRLFISLDSPHWGAHIPMSIQRLARYGQNRTPLLGPIIGRFLFTAFDVGLDGTAAKQMLREHVNTKSLLGVPTYSAHSKRTDFLSDVNALGGTPKYCKTIAMSNGNMNGERQTRLWDGDPRVAGDRLLEAESNLYGTILGVRFQFYGGYIKLNTNPNGVGQLGELSAGAWWFSIKLKWFGLRITTGFNTLANKYWEANMQAVSTSSGGVYNFNNEILSTLGAGNVDLPYTTNGNWVRNTSNKWGRTGFVGTDGMHWSFVPSASGLNYSGALNAQVESVPVGSAMSVAAYDVMMGPENDWEGSPTPNINLSSTNIFLRNRFHTAMRNDFLEDQSLPGLNKQIEYEHGCAAQAVRLLNREIGDDYLYLENRELPWQGQFSMHNDIVVNERSDFYEYDGVAIDPDKIRPRIFSRADPFEITGANGFGVFYTFGSVPYSPPFTGPYSTPPLVPDGQPCCTIFGTNKRTTNEPPITNVSTKVEEGIVLFPNPTNDDIVLKFVPTSKGELKYQLVDMQGRVVLKGSVRVRTVHSTYYLPIDLPLLSSGHYILQSKLNKTIYINKLKIN